MKCFLVFMWLLPSVVFSQAIRISEIKLKPNPKYYNTSGTTIIYPVIIAGNQSVSRLINDAIRKRIVSEDDKLNTREALRRMTNTGLTDLDYEVIYNKNGILSLKIGIQVEAAYPNSWNEFFNFDTRTGKNLTINDIVNDKMLEQFKSKVFADKVDSLKNYKDKELKELLQSEEIDSSTYQAALETVDSVCITSIDLDNFSISTAGIEIIDECGFPHFMRGVQPSYVLRYSYRFMAPYLRSAFKVRLTK